MKRPAEILAREEIDRLINANGRRSPTGIRNKALVVLLWRCGLRIAEALALQPKDVDFQAGTIRVLHGKGDKARTVGIDAQALAILDRWLDRRTKLGCNGKEPLFCTLQGKPVQSRYVRQLMQRLGKKAGIDKRVHAHGLRHTHASELRQEGVDIGIISKQLGHANIATTARYLDHVSPTAVVDAIKARTW